MVDSGKIFSVPSFALASTKHLFGGWIRPRQTRLARRSRFPSDQRAWAISKTGCRKTSCKVAGADSLEATGWVADWWRREGSLARSGEIESNHLARRDGFI